ncbi:hypothetical protein HRI_002559200 [Hibiscus trionum]|uniref:Uncharacterized protein n=1 Tax=Hibiscus trionum TaxID=183268 RepID=A0A9W7I3X0_HIBTR|nr:hypothetical protein HRI_002559200 [Hibiscus trionum]
MTDFTISDIIYPELKTSSRLEYLGTNFHIWRTKLDFVLKDHGVHYVLTPNPNPNPDHKWVGDDRHARRLILETLHEHLYMSYHKHETAKSLMDALTTAFTRHSAANRFRLLRRYKDYKMQEGTSIAQHIVEMNAMAKELELEGLNLPKELHSVALLESLPESWDDVVASITMDLGKDEEALRSDNICMKLMNAGDVKELFKGRV